MSQVPSINTSSYLKPRKVEVDGNVWTLKAPGAKQELALSQAQRRLKRLDQKIADESAVDADYDLYDTLEQRMYDMFKDIFVDETEGNQTVEKWLSEMPLSVVMQSFEDLPNQIKDKDEKKDEPAGTTEPTE